GLPFLCWRLELVRVVRDVPAGSLERDGRRGDELGHRQRAHLALGERRVAHLLLDFKAVPRIASVFVDRHRTDSVSPIPATSSPGSRAITSAGGRPPRYGSGPRRFSACSWR